MALTKSDLEAQNETNLLGLMSNQHVAEETRLYAAVLLYKRGSRFLSFEEWQKYKNPVLDYLLQEQSSIPPRPFAPNMPADLAGRLHTRLVAANFSVEQAHKKASDEFLSELEKQKKDYTSLCSSLFDKDIFINTKIRNLDKKLIFVYWSVSISFVLGLVVSYLIHHFLR